MKREKKTEFAPSPITRGLYLPPEAVEGMNLNEAKKLTITAGPNCVVALNKTMTAWQALKTVELLDTVAAEVLGYLYDAMDEFEEDVLRFAIPNGLLEMAGIPAGAPLDIIAEDGEIYISMADEEEDEDGEDDDPLEDFPDCILQLLERRGVDMGALRLLLESEDLIHE